MKKEQIIILVLSVISYGFLLYSFLTQNLWVLLISIVVSAVLLICFAILQNSDEEKIESDMLIADYKKKLEELDAQKQNLEAKVRESEAIANTASSRIEQAEAEVLTLKQNQEETTRKAVESAVADAIIKGQEEGKAAAIEEAKKNGSMAALIPEAASESGEIIDIISLCKNTIDEFESFAAKAQVTLKLNNTAGEIKVKADRERLRVMFRNVIDNSIKYMNKSGSLVVTISTIGSDIFVVLKDNGEGLDPSETEHIFELNFQGSNRISGNGLGLAQAKAIVEYYGGSVYAKSNLGGGMGIYIQIPAGISDEE